LVTAGSCVFRRFGPGAGTTLPADQLLEIRMSEDKAKHDDELLVSLQHEWERRNWTRWLHCSETELRHAVESVGPDADNVRRFLRQAR
jgi:Protein of unknown function (DUF3606)